jgi:hypothetical protein
MRLGASVDVAASATTGQPAPGASTCAHPFTIWEFWDARLADGVVAREIVP